jgi:hypothetical protein
MKRFSEMTSEELHEEIAKLQEQHKHAEFPSQLAIIESKIFTAQSYMLSKEAFAPGLYHVVGYEQPMTLEYLNGVMAWGTIQGEEVSFPIAMLQRI